MLLQIPEKSLGWGCLLCVLFGISLDGSVYTSLIQHNQVAMWKWLNRHFWSWTQPFLWFSQCHHPHLLGAGYTYECSGTSLEFGLHLGKTNPLGFNVSSEWLWSRLISENLGSPSLIPIPDLTCFPTMSFPGLNLSSYPCHYRCTYSDAA
jgi:hypothetical protein